MNNLIWSGVFLLLLLSGCGWDGTPTRDNDFVPLTSMEIVADSQTIAAKTSTRLRVSGNFSGQFTRDITDKVVWSSDATDKADFVTAADPSRVTGKSPGTAVLTATVGSVTTTFKLTVSSATISTLTITPADPTIFKGRNTPFAVSGTFSDGTTQDITFDANWASSVPTVAVIGDIVDDKRIVTALAVGTTTISATFDGVGSVPSLVTVTEPVLESITISPANPSLLSLTSKSFTATGHFSDGSSPDLTSQVAWSSSRPDFASIIATSGAATTHAQGTTVITATLANASGTLISGTTNLKVTGGNLDRIDVSPVTPKLVKDTSVPLTANGIFSNGATRDISGLVEWSVANSSIANVTKPGGNQALLNATAVTSVPTTVTAKFDTVTSSAINLTVSAPTPTLLTITAPPVSLPFLIAKTSARFTVMATFIDGTTQDVTANINTIWTSSNAAVATVADSGLAEGQVTGVAAGSTNISAKYNGVTATPVTVTVATRTLQSLTISGGTSVDPGNQVKFTALATYTDGTNREVNDNTVWSINNSNVAILADNTNPPGQVVGVDSGTAILTATFEGKSQTTTITVP